MLKNTFQAEEYAIIVLDAHKLNTTFTTLLGRRTLHSKHRVEKNTDDLKRTREKRRIRRHKQVTYATPPSGIAAEVLGQ